MHLSEDMRDFSSENAWVHQQESARTGQLDFFSDGDANDLSTIIYLYALAVVFLVVPFVMHIIVGCSGFVLEYFKCLSTRKYFEVASRSRRREFIGFHLTHFCILYDLVLLDTILGFDVFNLSDEQTLGVRPGYLTVAYYFLTIVPCTAMKVRRLHDTGRSGWWLCLELFPGLSLAVGVMMWFFDSEAKTNMYGPNPKAFADPDELRNRLKGTQADILEEGLVTFKRFDHSQQNVTRGDMATLMGYTKVTDFDEISLGPAEKV
jgi:uncharacterized membrane protein YhaH (DUF805 family)